MNIFQGYADLKVCAIALTVQMAERGALAPQHEILIIGGTCHQDISPTVGGEIVGGQKKTTDYADWYGFFHPLITRIARMKYFGALHLFNFVVGFLQIFRGYAAYLDS